MNCTEPQKEQNPPTNLLPPRPPKVTFNHVTYPQNILSFLLPSETTNLVFGWLKKVPAAKLKKAFGICDNVFHDLDPGIQSRFYQYKVKEKTTNFIVSRFSPVEVHRALRVFDVALVYQSIV